MFSQKVYHGILTELFYIYRWFLWKMHWRISMTQTVLIWKFTTIDSEINFNTVGLIPKIFFPICEGISEQ